MLRNVQQRNIVKLIDFDMDYEKQNIIILPTLYLKGCTIGNLLLRLCLVDVYSWVHDYFKLGWHNPTYEIYILFFF